MHIYEILLIWSECETALSHLPSQYIDYKVIVDDGTSHPVLFLATGETVNQQKVRLCHPPDIQSHCFHPAQGSIQRGWEFVFSKLTSAVFD